MSFISGSRCYEKDEGTWRVYAIVCAGAIFAVESCRLCAYHVSNVVNLLLCNLFPALQFLQSDEVIAVRRVVAEGNTDAISFYKSLGFKVVEESATEVKGSKAKATVLLAALGTINPDPQKRFS